VKSILKSAQALTSFIEKENYKGFDPYDGLTSPIFNFPILRSNKKIRFLAQQLIKRSPVDLRNILRIKKRLNPVTIGLCIQGYAYRYELLKDEKDLEKINNLIGVLLTLIPKGFKGACWGYDFPWEARYASIPAYQPTIVATGIITHALYETYRITKIVKAKELVLSSVSFVIGDLNRSIEADQTFCFSYSPFDKEKVLNASMKAVRLLAEAFALDSSYNHKSTAELAVKWVINQQQKDGSWIYSKSKTGTWIDNYHTAYVLDCLDSFQTGYNDFQYQKNINLGYKFYRDNFFEESGRPKFYSSESFPTDCTAAGQSLLTLTHFKDVDLAEKVAFYMLENMQDPNGGFYFRKFKNHLEKYSFMRWSNSWMFVGLWSLLREKNHRTDA
jgi:hypothetical protein